MDGTLPMFAVNGKSTAGYRIDWMGEGRRVGLDFLTHPVALVPQLEMARHICGLLNGSEKAAELAKRREKTK